LALLADVEAADTRALGAALETARAAGLAGAAVKAAGTQQEFAKLLAGFRDFVAIAYLSPEQIGWDVAPAQAVLRYGVWPGIATPELGRAGATASVWLDANTSLVAQLRAQFPKRRAVLGYRPDKDGGVPETRSLPARSAEVALADAYAAGGSVVLSLPENYRRGLLAGGSSELEAWKSLAGVQAFIRETQAVADAPLTGRTAVLCGTIEQSGEILNLAFRKNLCPVALPLAPPPLTATQFDVVVAANFELAPAAIENVARFAMSGGTVLAAPAGEEKNPWWTKRGWKKVRSEEDRDFYAAGRGTVIGYQTPVFDPGSFALDLKDAAGERSQPGLGVKNYDLRVWQADSVLGTLHRTAPGQVAAILTAYGGQMRREYLVGVRGRYRRGTVRQASDPAPRPVKLEPRSGRVEVSLPQSSRIAILSLEE
jgi:hypothetical protein